MCAILLRMLAADAFRADQWHDRYGRRGCGRTHAFGLRGPVVNLAVVMSDATHRYRSIGTLPNFAGIFVVCAPVLIGGQNHVAVGMEWLLVSSGAAMVYVYGYLRARTGGGSQTTLSLVRGVSGTAFYVAQVVGSIVLVLGATAGLGSRPSLRRDRCVLLRKRGAHAAKGHCSTPVSQPVGRPVAEYRPWTTTRWNTRSTNSLSGFCSPSWPLPWVTCSGRAPLATDGPVDRPAAQLRRPDPDRAAPGFSVR